MKSIIVGYGMVGKTMNKILPSADIYDSPLGLGNTDMVNKADIAFICVPTPMAEDGSCDTSIVKEIVVTLKPKLWVIRSTVPPGFCRSMKDMIDTPIVFQPEYVGETLGHPYKDGCGWITLGGDSKNTQTVASFWSPIFHSSMRFHFVDWETAELAKYMENCFFATKIIFCSEFAAIAKVVGVDYHALREAWLMDTRINSDHTSYYQNDPGFGGKCLPKDLSAIIHNALTAGISTPLLSTVQSINKKIR